MVWRRVVRGTDGASRSSQRFADAAEGRFTVAHAVQFAASARRASDGVWRVVVEGDLDMATAVQLDAVLGDPSLADATTIELDLSDVGFLDSSGLRSIVQFATGLERRGGRLVISGMSAAAERVLEVTGVLERLRERAASE